MRNYRARNVLDGDFSIQIVSINLSVHLLDIDIAVVEAFQLKRGAARDSNHEICRAATGGRLDIDYIVVLCHLQPGVAGEIKPFHSMGALRRLVSFAGARTNLYENILYVGAVDLDTSRDQVCMYLRRTRWIIE